MKTKTETEINKVVVRASLSTELSGKVQVKYYLDESIPCYAVDDIWPAMPTGVTGTDNFRTALVDPADAQAAVDAADTYTAEARKKLLADPLIIARIAAEKAVEEY